MCEAVIRNRLRRNLINIVNYYCEKVPAATRSKAPIRVQWDRLVALGCMCMCMCLLAVWDWQKADSRKGERGKEKGERRRWRCRNIGTDKLETGRAGSTKVHERDGGSGSGRGAAQT